MTSSSSALLRSAACLLLLTGSALSAPALAQNSMPPVPPPLSDVQRPGVMTLDVDATDIVHAVMSVRQSVPVSAPGPLVLRMPQWLPGNHAPRGPIAQLANLSFTANGRPLVWHRDPTDVYSFRVDVPAGVRSVDIRFDALTPTRSAEGRVVMTPAMLNVQWEQVLFYPAGYAVRAIRVRPSVTLPTGWTAAGALDGATIAGNRVRYGETNVETLVDSPLFAGAHSRRWELGHNVAMNVFADQPGQLAATPDMIANHRALVDESVTLFGARHFDRYEFLMSLTNELGDIGLEHHRSSENGFEPTLFTDWANSGYERGLLPHEFTHSWDGKHRRPARLWTADYATPMQNDLLWVYEGQTQFWGIILAARSGLMERDMVLGQWARLAAFYQAQPGRSWRSVEDTTFDPIIAARRPRSYPTQTRTEDYYNESALVWLEADALIRERSNGARGMDDFARGFFGGRDGDWGVRTYEFADVVAALNAVEPYDWATFLRTRIQTAGQPAPLAGIERGGYRLVFRDTPNSFDASRMRGTKSVDLTFSIGIGLDNEGTITSVQWGGPMFAAGATNGMKIIAVNGEAYSETRLKAAIAAAGGNGNPPITLTVRRGDRISTITPAWTGGLRYPWLERVGTGPANLDRLLEPRRALR
jgi:predicted metalloprotease with PDZ domain